MPDNPIASQNVWNQQNDAELEDAVDAVRDARIVIMNPPFDRSKMGEKFPKEIQQALRSRVNFMEEILVRNDQDLENFVDKNALEPMFTALGDRCVNTSNGVLAMITPTVALSATSAQQKRRVMAQRFYIHTILTCHQPRQANLSQKANINESIIVAIRHGGPKPPTQFINLDRFPIDDVEVSDLHACLMLCSKGPYLQRLGRSACVARRPDGSR